MRSPPLNNRPYCQGPIACMRHDPSPRPLTANPAQPAGSGSDEASPGRTGWIGRRSAGSGGASGPGDREASRSAVSHDRRPRRTGESPPPGVRAPMAPAASGRDARGGAPRSGTGPPSPDVFDGVAVSLPARPGVRWRGRAFGIAAMGSARGRPGGWPVVRLRPDRCRGVRPAARLRPDRCRGWPRRRPGDGSAPPGSRSRCYFFALCRSMCLWC